MTNTPTPLRQAISAQDRFTEADAPSMTDANGTSYRTPGSSSVDDDGDDDFEPPRDSSNSSDTLQDLLNEIALKADQKTREGRKRGSRRARKSDKRRRRESGMESYGTDDGSVADTDSLPPTDEEREDADVENVRLDLQDRNTDRTPRVRRTESYPERVALERSRVSVGNKTPPMQRLVDSSWTELSDELEKYSCDNYRLFRARDTRTVKKHNSMSDLQIPVTLDYSYKVFRCTHGCPQKFRGTGQRVLQVAILDARPCSALHRGISQKQGKLKSGESFYATGGFGEARNAPANTQHSAKGSEEHGCG
ncbi:uncharacterized protein PITG_20420 [Phytophthora infestans T30-4]|uniref:Uncharacterized protein n=1 Tax=Phytophthora infestans (strain T30-4) TaxID=403677 RepID=D0P231_PHYIT|nr:uncharacterized protein PITG_20420 [Phytophthora infestans T30-4]EEY55454.1 conserved hypothetical protein [Phytophthora infestans T30-4]|eukprot:XP_002895648.1 conserved hypothetical protein [Phytophthora infestans T30-4]